MSDLFAALRQLYSLLIKVVSSNVAGSELRISRLRVRAASRLLPSPWHPPPFSQGRVSSRAVWFFGRGGELVNPFTATACKISGLESAHIHASKQYSWLSCNKSTFNSVHSVVPGWKVHTYTPPNSIADCPATNLLSIECIVWKSIYVLIRRGKTSLHGFQFVTFTGRFPTDQAASVAVKGLRSCVA